MANDDPDFDAIVIGGGVNGAGVARDLTLRGVKVALYERGDLAGGTTGASSGMIHGGMRYLLYDRAVTRASCQDSGYIQKVAPHLIFRIPFLLPLGGRGPLARIYDEAVEAFFAAYDAFQPLKGGKPHARLTAAEALRVEPGLARDLTGALTMDEWGIDTNRLVLINALDAAERGAVVKTYHEVQGVLRGPRGEVTGVRVKDRRAGRIEDVKARVVVNCAGPWAEGMARLAGCRSVRLRPSKGVHVTLERRISDMAILSKALDGRAVFVQPHENTTIIGTTDDDFFGDPASIPITHDEVGYLLDAAERVLPAVRDHRVLRAWAGVRPTLFEANRNEDDLSRRHEVFDHERADGVRGLVTLAGGKLATYRLMAEETADLVLWKLGRGGVDRHEARIPPAGGAGFTPGAFGCRTHETPLPGGDAAPTAKDVAARHGIDAYAAARLVFRHGSRAEAVLEASAQDPSARRAVCVSEPVTEAEIRWCCRKEWVTCLEDLRRRTRFGEGPCQGLECVREGARILADELGWDGATVERETLRFLEARFRERAPVLAGRQLAQEELLQSAMLGVEGIGRAFPAGEAPL